MAEWTLEQAWRKAWELLQNGRFREAERMCEGILEVRPRDPELWHMLGFLASRDQRSALAEARLREALRLRHDYPNALNTLGSHLEATGRYEEAQRALDRALELQPGFLEALYNKAKVLQAMGRLEEAETHYLKVLEQKPEAADAHNNLGLAYQQLGRPERALACFREAVRWSPRDARLHSNLLMAMNYVDDLSPEAIKEAHLAWARIHAEPLAPRADPFAGHPRRERLRIGYVSADFRKHSVAFLLEGVLRAHDRGGFELFAYHSHPSEDEVSQRFKGYVDHWIPCAAMADEELAGRIRRDGIDILVDLSGHTEGNRLPVFARRPAPVQATWLGYQNTTGLSTMDFRLTDRFLDPVGTTEHLYTERLVRLPIRQCFEPPQAAPDVSPLPALRAGRVTFASLNAFRKITPTGLDLWAEVLRKIPEARLIVMEAGSPEAQQFLESAFSSRGVEPGRLDLRGKVSPQEFLAMHSEVDIAFDPFPYGGGITTCLGFWMGVPVVALSGATVVSRSGARLLAPMGMEDWIAKDPEEYVRIAVEKARDLESLSHLRAGLRERLKSSPLAQPEALARALEAAFQGMMETWHQARPGQ